MAHDAVEADRQTDHACWAVWRMADEELLGKFRRAVRDADVYELMDQVDLCGTAGDPTEVLGEMVGVCAGACPRDGRAGCPHP